MKNKLSVILILILVTATVGLGIGAPLLRSDGDLSADTAFAAQSQAVSDPKIVIDGKTVPYDDQMGWPYIDQNRRTQVPLNRTMTAFGASVTWNASTRTASVSKGGTTVEVPIGEHYISVNGKHRPIDTAAIIRRGRTYLPINPVLSAFGASVTWNASTRTVTIVSGGSSALLTDGITVHYIDVGQGDAILIDAGDFEILIDGGPRSAASTVTDYLKPLVDGTLDVVIATHNHEDHIGGLPTVLQSYDVDRVIDNGKKASSKIYQQYAAAVTAEGCRYENGLKKNITIAMDDIVSLRLIGMEGNFSDANNCSLVACFTAGNTSFLFTGDMEQPLEKANLSQFDDIDVLKAGHHGSSTGSSEAFLHRTKPETVIISCATGNTYRHPHLAALQRYKKIGAAVYGTEKSGSIQVSTDGNSYRVSASEPLTLEDAGDRN